MKKKRTSSLSISDKLITMSMLIGFALLTDYIHSINEYLVIPWLLISIMGLGVYSSYRLRKDEQREFDRKRGCANPKM